MEHEKPGTKPDSAGNVSVDAGVRPPVRHCDECVHYQPICGVYGGKNDKLCDLGHEPRWYRPRSPVDDKWGHKRRCEDFKDDRM